MDRRTVAAKLVEQSNTVVDSHIESRPTFGECESRTPLVSQNIQTDATVGVDVGVVDASGEVDLGGLEWVVGREVNLEEEDTARVRRVGLSS